MHIQSGTSQSSPYGGGHLGHYVASTTSGTYSSGICPNDLNLSNTLNSTNGESQYVISTANSSSHHHNIESLIAGSCSLRHPTEFTSPHSTNAGGYVSPNHPRPGGLRTMTEEDIHTTNNTQFNHTKRLLTQATYPPPPPSSSSSSSSSAHATALSPSLLSSSESSMNPSTTSLSLQSLTFQSPQPLLHHCQDLEQQQLASTNSVPGPTLSYSLDSTNRQSITQPNVDGSSHHTETSSSNPTFHRKPSCDTIRLQRMRASCSPPATSSGGQQQLQQQSSINVDSHGTHNNRMISRDSMASKPGYWLTFFSSGVPYRILLPATWICHVVGKGGKTVNQISQSTSALIQVVRDHQLPNLDDKIVLISGPSTEAKQAGLTEMLKQLQNKTNQNLTDKEGQTAVVVLVPEKAVSLIIGSKGNTINRISKNCNCDIQFLSDVRPLTLLGYTDRAVSIRGKDLNRIASGIAQIHNILSDMYKKRKLTEADFVFSLRSPASGSNTSTNIPSVGGARPSSSIVPSVTPTTTTTTTTANQNHQQYFLGNNSSNSGGGNSRLLSAKRRDYVVTPQQSSQSIEKGAGTSMHYRTGSSSMPTTSITSNNTVVVNKPLPTSHRKPSVRRGGTGGDPSIILEDDIETRKRRTLSDCLDGTTTISSHVKLHPSSFVAIPHLLKEVINNTQDTVTLKLVTSTSHVGWVIGNAGIRKRDIESVSSASIKILNHFPSMLNLDPSDRVVIIKGNPMAVGRAVNIIIMGYEAQDRSAVIPLRLIIASLESFANPSSHVFDLVTKHSGATLHLLPNRNRNTGNEPRLLDIAGVPESKVTALMLLLENLLEAHRTTLQPSSSSRTKRRRPSSEDIDTYRKTISPPVSKQQYIPHSTSELVSSDTNLGQHHQDYEVKPAATVVDSLLPPANTTVHNKTMTAVSPPEAAFIREAVQLTYPKVITTSEKFGVCIKFNGHYKQLLDSLGPNAYENIETMINCRVGGEVRVVAATNASSSVLLPSLSTSATTPNFNGMVSSSTQIISHNDIKKDNYNQQQPLVNVVLEESSTNDTKDKELEDQSLFSPTAIVIPSSQNTETLTPIEKRTYDRTIADHHCSFSSFDTDTDDNSLSFLITGTPMGNATALLVLHEILMNLEALSSSSAPIHFNDNDVSHNSLLINHNSIKRQISNEKDDDGDAILTLEDDKNNANSVYASSVDENPIDTHYKELKDPNDFYKIRNEKSESCVCLNYEDEESYQKSENIKIITPPPLNILNHHTMNITTTTNDNIDDNINHIDYFEQSNQCNNVQLPSPVIYSSTTMNNDKKKNVVIPTMTTLYPESSSSSSSSCSIDDGLCLNNHDLFSTSTPTTTSTTTTTTEGTTLTLSPLNNNKFIGKDHQAIIIKSLNIDNTTTTNEKETKKL